MRNFEHYLNLFESSETIGRRLVARAIYAGRYGNADNPEINILRDLTRELPETLPSEEAIKIAIGASAWKDFLKEDPIPSWTLRLGIQALEITQVEFAERMNVDPSTVRRWLADIRSCSGASAKLASIILA